MRKSGKQRNGDGKGHHRDYLKLKSLWDISQSLHQYLNVDELILHIIDRISKVMRVEAVSVIIHDEEKDELVFCWSSDSAERREKLSEIRLPADRGIAGSVFTSGKAELVSDVTKDLRHYSEVDGVTEFKTKSLIAVPLKTKKKSIGVLEVLNKIRGTFGNRDLDFLQTLAPIVAMAIENASMYSKLGKAYEELQILDQGKDELLKQTQNEVDLLRREVERRNRFDQIVGNSDRMLDVFKLCERVIDTDITVLIEGETGTGKELVARTIHYSGPRRKKPFLAQNCGGIPDTLLASELFGHKKGAFTGAVSDRRGLLEMANGGTIFLDEVGEMSPAMQTSLLRFLQEGEIKPLGTEYGKNVDVRVISATNRSLEERVKARKFREDLFYRLNVFAIGLPPLRDRIGDIPLLADHCIKKYKRKAKKSVKGLSREAMQCLEAYPFPGNVRELENEIERAMAMAEGGKHIEIFHLSDRLQNKSLLSYSGPKSEGPLKQIVEAVEKSVLSDRLIKHRGNKTKVARDLGLSRNGLMKKMQRYGL